LSISSMKTMPFCSALGSARCLISSSLTSLAASSSTSSASASAMLQLARLALALPDLAEHAAQLLGHLLHAGGAHDLQLWAGASARSISISLSSSGPRAASCATPGARCCRPAAARSLPQSRCAPRGGGPARPGCAPRPRPRRACAAPAHLALALLLDGHFDQVAHDGVHVLADIADLGELGGLDLDEGRIGQPRQAARDLGLADAGGADHQDVLGRDLAAQLLVDLLAAPAVAQRDGHGALGLACWPTMWRSSSETISWGVMHGEKFQIGT
jgi:hypothetical protein